MHAVSVVTSKGQVTLPKPVRDFLHSKTIEFEISGDKVVMRPVRSVGGSLKRYAKDYQPLEQVRDKVWAEVAGEKA
jgi:AbrB family looped-hinge helix DNA binding protein